MVTLPQAWSCYLPLQPQFIAQTFCPKILEYEEMLVSRKTILALTLAVALLHGANSVSPQASGMCVGSQTDLYNGDVMTGGVVKAMETWDAKPYNSFAKWDTDVSANGKA